MRHRLVLASGNPGKVNELQDLLGNFGCEVIPQSRLGVPDADETGLSFVENAILKARNASEHTGLPAIADDSGLEVDALQGAPGIYSARYAGIGANDQTNNQKLLETLNAFGENERNARFHCVLVLMRHATDPTPLIAHGSWEGEILFSPRGKEGFGYDPLFWVRDKQKSAAELSKAEKGEISHRGQALRKLIEMIEERAFFEA